MPDDLDGPWGRPGTGSLRPSLWRVGVLRVIAAAIAIAVAAALPAHATPVSVTPTSVTLAPGQTTELVSLVNESDARARFEVTLFAWNESPEGKTELEPTQDLIAFPPLFEIAPHQTRNIRIGAVASFAAAERSYRIIIQELPSATPPAAQVQIQVLTKISLPVFLLPPGASAATRIEAPRLENGVLHFSVFNPGTAHLVLHRIEIAGDGSGSSSFKVSQAGWYLLAGGRRDYQLALSRADCRNTSRVTISVLSDGPKAEAQVPITAGACGDAVATRFIEAGRTETQPQAR